MRSSLILILSFCFLTPANVTGDTIYVPQQQATIQLAIEAASDGDTILVTPNRYLESINFLGKAITLRSDVDGDPTTHDISPITTTIDAESGRVVLFEDYEGPDSVLDGFTLTGGYVAGVDGGGGIYCAGGSSPTLLNNIVHRNSAYGFGLTGPGRGGGINCEEGSFPHIHNHLIFDNSTDSKFGQGGEGSGIYVAGSALITNSTITQNELLRGSVGGIYANSSTVIVNTIVWNNPGAEIYGNPTVAYSNIEGQIFPGTGNISQDPLFFLPFFDFFHLNQDPPQPGIVNPCVDAGHPATPIFDGSTRTDGVQDAGVIDMGFHYPITATLHAIPDVKVNGEDSPLTVTAGTYINITVSLAPQDKSGINADWWMLVLTSHPPPYDLYSYDLNQKSFVPGIFPTFQGPLPPINLPTTTIFEGTSIGSASPEGTYYVFFIVDLNMNGVLDQPFYLDFFIGTII